MNKVSIDRSLPDRNELWRILVETVHAMPMYITHKRYVSEVMLKEKSDISSKELAVIINITLGEAIVILTEIADEKKDTVKVGDARKSDSQITDRKLFDFSQ
ncbi:MAG TPA: hypothetical protein VJZ32_12160 [Candidatus Bathyarchaeia archaeon]|nr:hypothetical protein [Candidatus Bathyarchaeia archaeon]